MGWKSREAVALGYNCEDLTLNFCCSIFRKYYYSVTTSAYPEQIVLFKYVRAEKGRYALGLLKCFCEKHTLMASPPTSFNDPFEFKFSVDFDADEATIRERYFLNKP